MKQTNPKFTLRNYLLEEAIKDAEKDDYKKVEELLKMSENPFDEIIVSDYYTKTPPEWAYDLCVSCSS